MKTIFTDSYLEELAKPDASIGKPKFPEEVVKKFKERLFVLKTAENTQVLRTYKQLHFEKLKEKRYDGKYSIRLNKAYRLIFGIDKQGNYEIISIDEISNHYS